MRIVLDSLRTGYQRLCYEILSNGDITSPRGQRTREVRGATYVVSQPECSLTTGIGRGINVRLAVVEALQLIGGVSVPKLMTKVAPNTTQFLDGEIFSGAYGPRLRHKIPIMLDRLHGDRDTRRAYANIWTDEESLIDDRDSRDLPCNTSVQWFIRDGALEQHVYARSQDAWWGVPYDVFAFTQLQITMAHALDVGVGMHHHHVGSLHLYERDWEKVDDLMAVEKATAHWGLGMHGTPWRTSSTLARSLLNPIAYIATVTTVTETERWYLNHLQEVHAA